MIAVLTADLIDSSLYEEKVLQEVLDTLKQEFERIIGEYKEEDIRLQIYRGDSFQGIIKNPEDALKIALQIKTAINRIHFKETVKNRAYSKIADFKIAIGIGEQELDREAISESNGPAFQFSGRSLDEMKTENRKTKLKTDFEEINDEFNTSLFLLDTITDKWSTASAEVVYYLLKDLKEREVAAAINISQSAVNQRKKAAGWDAISVLLDRYKAVITNNLVNRK
ncbi:SatD family protein [Gillisia sp. CAL575]|uniref:SatD family protein n=1 Tax=Gillisia sp. CAL575 TaxID=985255 RepID=UPI00039C03B6|nr:SatD family protein [Gillisia sp. CAL575]